jgi:hypothetical protein
MVECTLQALAFETESKGMTVMEQGRTLQALAACKDVENVSVGARLDIVHSEDWEHMKRQGSELPYMPIESVSTCLP